jgi:hypothetical protein
MNRPSLLCCFVLLLASSALGAGCNGSAFDGAPHQTDEEMIAHFHAQRPAFDTLRKMMLRDSGLIAVTEDSTEPAYHLDFGISRERIAEYRRLLTQAGIAEGIAATPERDRIDLLASTQQMLNRGSIKGYLYSDSIRDDTIDAGARLPSTTDDLSPGPPAFETWTRRIDGNWYLFFERY